MKYVIDVAPTKNGAKLYKLYIVIDDKKMFVTSFFENRYNRGAVKQINAKDSKIRDFASRVRVLIKLKRKKRE